MIEYRDTTKFPGYRVGSDGSVWSCRLNSGRTNPDRWKRISGRVDRDGYIQMKLSGGFYYAHRLVLEAFVGPCPDGHECCHGDGDPANNKLSNLRWDTPKANWADQVRHGTAVRLRGEDHSCAKLTEADVLDLRRRYAAGDRPAELALRFGVRKGHVIKIVRRESWAHLA